MPLEDVKFVYCKLKCLVLFHISQILNSICRAKRRRANRVPEKALLFCHRLQFGEIKEYQTKDRF